MSGAIVDGVAQLARGGARPMRLLRLIRSYRAGMTEG